MSIARLKLAILKFQAEMVGNLITGILTKRSINFKYADYVFLLCTLLG